MDYQYGRTASWHREVIEIDNFILKNDQNGYFSETRKHYYWNYLSHLERVCRLGQVLVQRKNGVIVGVCGWIRVSENDQKRVNKVAWRFPKEISKGPHLYISFCLVNGGDLRAIRRELKTRLAKDVDDVYWFNVPGNHYVRRKIILKEAKNGASH